MDSFCAQAPSYVDFTAGSPPEDDIDYFGIMNKERIKFESGSPEYFQTPSEFDNYGALRRRSKSVGNLSTLFSDSSSLNNLCDQIGYINVSESTESLVDTNTNFNNICESKENLSCASQPHRVNKYESMAEKIRKFHSKTPTRYHTVSSKAEAVRVLSELNHNHDIKPKTPRLLTKSRSRPISALTAEQREELEYQEIQKNKPKQHVFNRNILHKAPSLPNVPRLPVTKVEPFNITKPKHKVIIEEKPIVFKARPLPVRILKGPVGIKERGPPRITEARTPNIKMPVKKTIMKNEHQKPDPVSSFRPGKTQIAPFSFEERDKRMLERKEKFIQQYIQQEMAKKNHIARPMPKFETPKKPSNVKTKLVIPKTPNFASKKIREEAERKFKAKLEQEEQEAKARMFIAQPAKILHKKPFEPQLNHQSTSKLKEFHLMSEERAKARKAFDEQLKLKEQEMIREQEEIKAAQQKLEEEQIMIQRKNLVIKAQPIKYYKPIEIKPSNKITTPSTPQHGNKS